MNRLIERANLLGATAPEHYLLPSHLSRHTKPHDPLNGQLGHNPDDHQQSLRTSWANICRVAAKYWEQRHPGEFNPFPTLRPHDCRHSFVTWLGEAGTPIEQVMALVGHLSRQMVLYYTHLHDAATRRVVDVVAQTISLEVPTGEKPIAGNTAVLQRIC
jgi:integrase